LTAEEIDKRRTLSRRASTPSAQLLQHVFGEHIAAGEFRALFHQFEERILAISTYQRHIAEIDDQSTPLKVILGMYPGPFHFGCPRMDQRSLQNQPPAAFCLND
jgi:hypothetical protein